MPYADVLGWAELMNGSIVTAAYKSLDVGRSADGTPGYLFILTFIVITAAIYLRTNNMGLMFVLSLITFMLVGAAGVFLNFWGRNVFVFLLVFELAFVLLGFLIRDRENQ